MARTLGLVAAGAMVSGALASIQTCQNSSLATSCSSSSRLTARASGSCCLESPGGLLIQTQFWDAQPAIGPADSWGIHGLWPDNCDGTYQSSCDSSREYDDIESLLESAGKTDTLSYMKKYWQSNDQSVESFWEHEWAKHGTCINTIDPKCYTNYKKGDEAVDFFGKVVSLFKTLDTYSALEKAGITPDDSKTYKLSDIEDAAGSLHDGKKVYFSCENDELSAAYYYFHLRGNAINGEYIAVDTPEDSDCPSSGIKYPPKESSS
ncbi:ribonuclease T2, putative [Talaromyces islandicus]|uniref:ribonuclease T2 n=1 Tax=Talaromyces islandicus TaxID=28573 RepID=A0A0U1M0U0_TALIS|nr:ribonuclease T2, putative [Talaromyces islandicus]